MFRTNIIHYHIISYSMNSIMILNKSRFMTRGLKTLPGVDTITLGAGCFWCVEAVYRRVSGVLRVENGYMGGTVEKPSYEQICSGATGHTEVVQLKYDTRSVSTAELLEIFFKVNDPTAKNKNVETQYKSAIFCHTEEQKNIAKEVIDVVQPKFWRPIITEVNISGLWYPADKSHQDFYTRNKGTNEYCSLVIHPKLSKIEHERFDIRKKN